MINASCLSRKHAKQWYIIVQFIITAKSASFNDLSARRVINWLPPKRVWTRTRSISMSLLIIMLRIKKRPRRRRRERDVNCERGPTVKLQTPRQESRARNWQRHLRKSKRKIGSTTEFAVGKLNLEWTKG